MKRAFALIELPPASKRGFSLIELLVVVTIIVVLLALLAPALDKAIYQAGDRKRDRSNHHETTAFSVPIRGLL